MLPYDTNDRAEAYSQGYAFAYPAAIASATARHAGSVPADQGCIRFNSEYIRMSAFKKAENGTDVILRLFNTAEHTVSLTAELPTDFQSARLLNLVEEPIQALDPQNGQIKLDVPAKKILTIELIRPF